MKRSTEAVLVLPDGTERPAPAGASARDLLRAAELPRPERVLAVKVDGILRDLAAPVHPGPGSSRSPLSTRRPFRSCATPRPT